MADRLAKLFEKNDKKKQVKSKSGLNTFTDPLSGETSFDMQAVKISLSSAGKPENSEVLENSSVDIGRAEGNLTEWSSTKPSLFTEKETDKSENQKFQARGRKKLGVENIKWCQLPSGQTEESIITKTTLEEISLNNPDLSKDSVNQPAASKNFVARGKNEFTGPASNKGSSQAHPSENLQNPVQKTFVARGKPGSSGFVSSSSRSTPKIASTSGVTDVSSFQSNHQPGRYIPPSRR